MKAISALGIVLILFCPLVALGQEQVCYRVTYPEGLTIVIERLPNVEGVALKAMVRTGDSDGAGERVSEEVQDLLASLLLRGESHPAVSEELSRLYEEVGGGVTAFSDGEVTEFSVITLQQNWQRGVELLALLLTQPRIRESDLEQVRWEQIERITEDFSLVGAARRLLEDRLLGKGLGGFLLRRREQLLRQVTLRDLQQAYQQCYCLRNMIVVAVGNLDPSFTAEYIAESFKKKIPSRPRLLNSVARRRMESYSWEREEAMLGWEKGTKVIVVEEETPAAVLAMGFKVPGMGSSDYPALLVLNALVGGGKGSRLFRYLRGREGIGYEMGGWLSPGLREGVLIFYVVTQPYRINLRGEREPLLEKTRQILREQIEAVCRGDFSEAELARARQYLKGVWLIRRERISDRASLTGRWALASVKDTSPEDFLKKIEGVSRKQILAVAKEYMRNPLTALILPRQGGLISSRGVDSW